MNYLSADKILDLHKVSSNNNITLFNIVYTHSSIIRDISLKIAENLKVDKNLIIIGAMLHDIGVYNCFNKKFEKIKPYITHGDEGYKILLQKKLPQNIE